MGINKVPNIFFQWYEFNTFFITNRYSCIIMYLTDFEKVLDVKLY